jgi:hypothetical protein
MRLVSPTRRAALVAAAVTAAAGAAIALGPLGDGPAAADTPSSSAPSVSASGDPIVTPLAAALVPGPIDIDRRHPSNVVSVRIDFRAGAHDGVALPPRPGPCPGRLRSGHPPACRPRPMPVPGRPCRARLLRGPRRRPRRREPPTGPGRPLCHFRPPTKGRARGECADPGALPLSVAEAAGQRTDDLYRPGSSVRGDGANVSTHSLRPATLAARARVDVHASGRFRTLYRAPADINQNILPSSELSPWAPPHMYQTVHVRPDSPV